MRLITYKEKDLYRPACVFGEHVIDIQNALKYYQSSHEDGLISLEHIPASIKDFLSLDHVIRNRVLQALQYSCEQIINSRNLVAFKNTLLKLAEITLAPPIPNPGKIICVAMNYPSANQKQKTEYPTIFIKPVSTISAAQRPILLAKANQNVTYEAELAFVIGNVCHNVSVSDALSCIFGYTIANDVGDSTLEKRTSQWVSGKMFDSFTPIGPCLLTADEIPDPHKLSIQTRLNGEIVQKGNTAEMFFRIPEITSYLSTLTTLRPGDVVLTGSPKLIDNEPIPQVSLRAGDRVEITISELGTLVNSVFEEE